MLSNIFAPIVEATLNPEKHPEISEFLKKVVAFDFVSDEYGTVAYVLAVAPPSIWGIAASIVGYLIGNRLLAGNEPAEQDLARA